MEEEAEGNFRARISKVGWPIYPCHNESNLTGAALAEAA